MGAAGTTCCGNLSHEHVLAPCHHRSAPAGTCPPAAG
jgi:hypothetical protein